jgi:alginate O-acetyltransferase complex protein AlgI
MLFNSHIFIFLFLPIVLLGFHLIGKLGTHTITISWLVSASLFFYGWWNPVYLLLILGSILVNYSTGISLLRRPSKLVLVAGIAINLGALGYFKYANFFVDTINALISSDLFLNQVVLPLAISFFTFQQITYLVDMYRGEASDYGFLRYCLFVTFFPQLIAGPIVHHKEMLNQFSKEAFHKQATDNLAVGLTIFIIGLFKKVVIADGISVYVISIFEGAEHGIALTFFESWGGALAYTLQLYFDFSGYSDMAIGLARMFGVMLPVSFFSPYKANNIIEFWKLWHITLSRFFRDYIYIPLGGNRKGTVRHFANIGITMLLGGLWHGANWTFVIWGGMHGIFLAINHGWCLTKTKLLGKRVKSGNIFGVTIGRVITFISVVAAWVMFRSESLAGAMNMYHAMFAGNGISLPGWAESKFLTLGFSLEPLGITFDGMFHNGLVGRPMIWYVLVFIPLVWFAPNTLELLRHHKPALNAQRLMKEKPGVLIWRESIYCSLFIAILAVWSIMKLHGYSEFLYFNF